MGRRKNEKERNGWEDLGWEEGGTLEDCRK